MHKPQSMRALEELGRVRLSQNFFMRDFLHSEIASFYGLQNIPDEPDLAIMAGRKLCEDALEPLAAQFGRISIRSAYRSPAVNRFGNEHNLNCGSNDSNFGGHIWDHRTAKGELGACATIVVHALLPLYDATGRWEPLAWWIHDHLPYDELEFFPRLAAFNYAHGDRQRRRIRSYIPPRRGVLTKAGMDNAAGRHTDEYADWLASLA
ncbi:MAG: hypothetical protein ABI697_01855 [Devosia sp.]